ncbi:MAG TPA: ketohexokinase [Sedimenticola thiotaurini]|uniref:Ketohexokinase n=1 Tax=Sedimenticola thiotaurini TaxID=1543721 RepID=A0A831W2Y9_9GAMM|nr:ketohexokinase [Sedimenticola thiotaurini]
MQILVVGTATLDIVSRVPRYPAEDEEVRADWRQERLGGNAANTAVVLAQLGHRVSWAGTLAADRDGDWIGEQLRRQGVATEWARRCDGGRAPVSCITLSRAGGSRTIIHFRDLPEFTAGDFARIATAPFDWVHFEGRNVPDLERMLARLPPGLPCSLEVEKPRPGIESLFGRPDLLLFSRHYARATGFDAAAPFLEALGLRAGAVAACAWGDEGGWVLDREGEVRHSPAVPPAQVVDTLGAGDVFNAGFIDRLAAGAAPSGALAFACRLAGRKCGRSGLGGLGGEGSDTVDGGWEDG